MPLVNAVLSGETGRLSAELRRMRELSLNPVAVLLAIERRAAQIAQLSAKLGRGRKPADLLEAERVFWRDRKDLGVQLERWKGAKLERLVQRLTALHRALLAPGNGQAAELLLAQELTQIARQAAASRR
jgi:DNA polymerase-3 subunit delta